MINEFISEAGVGGAYPGASGARQGPNLSFSTNTHLYPIGLI